MNEHEFDDDLDQPHLPMKHPALTLDDIASVPTLTVPQAAQVLQISKPAVYRAIKAGQIPAVTIGRTRRIPTKPLLRLLGASDE